jgi:2-amino-4-hydroxy-6-hydroxymethyldihydropteridine diphosphokinase
VEPIIIAVGANLPYENGQPIDTCLRAVQVLDGHGVRVTEVAPWYETAPVPANDDPWFVNGVLTVQTALPPQDLLDHLHTIERDFLRHRAELNAPRTLDLDLLAYGDMVLDDSKHSLVIPHPRLHERAFVLKPLVDILPRWRHPVLGKTAKELYDSLPLDDKAPQKIRPFCR